MSKQVYDIGIEVKRAYMHVLAESPEEAIEIAKEHLDEWYNDWYFHHEHDIDDCPEIADCSESIYIEDYEDDPIYGDDEYETLGEYISESEDDEDEEYEYEDPRQLKLFEEGGDK